MEQDSVQQTRGCDWVVTEDLPGTWKLDVAQPRDPVHAEWLLPRPADPNTVTGTKERTSHKGSDLFWEQVPLGL